MTNIHVTSTSKLSTLLLLSQGPKHGYELLKALKEKMGQPSSAGQIYPFLAELQKKKFISVTDTGDRQKKTYSLTPTGKQFVKEVLENFNSLVAAAVEDRLSSCAHCNLRIYGPGYSEKIKGKPLNFCCKYCAKSYTS